MKGTGVMAIVKAREGGSDTMGECTRVSGRTTAGKERGFKFSHLMIVGPSITAILWTVIRLAMAP